MTELNEGPSRISDSHGLSLLQRAAHAETSTIHLRLALEERMSYLRSRLNCTIDCKPRAARSLPRLRRSLTNGCSIMKSSSGTPPPLSVKSILYFRLQRTTAYLRPSSVSTSARWRSDSRRKYPQTNLRTLEKKLAGREKVRRALEPVIFLSANLFSHESPGWIPPMRHEVYLL